MIVEYDGSDFWGWQIQPNRRTVQGVLQETIAKYARQRIVLVAAGRTDAGVHATGQVCSFSLDEFIEPAELYYRINRILPDDICVGKIGRAPEGFDPRRHAHCRSYRYYIAESPKPLYRHMQYRFYRRLNIDILNKSARMFIGNHDFAAFCRRKSLKGDNRCRVFASRWFRYGGALVYEVNANRFLHHMVRRMVGAMLAVECSKINLTHIKAFLNNKENVRFNVPANGLVLTKVSYRREGK